MSPGILRLRPSLANARASNSRTSACVWHRQHAIRTDRHPEVRALPFQELRLGAAGVGKPQRDAVVVGNCNAESFRCKGKTGNGRRGVEHAQVILARADVRGPASRPCNRVIWAERDMIHPSLLFVRCELAVITISTCCDQLAVVTSGNDTFSIGGTVENCACMNGDAPLAIFTRE